MSLPRQTLRLEHHYGHYHISFNIYVSTHQYLICTKLPTVQSLVPSGRYSLAREQAVFKNPSTAQSMHILSLLSRSQIPHFAALASFAVA